MGIVKFCGMWLLFILYLCFCIGRLTATAPFSTLAYLGYLCWLTYYTARVRKSSNETIAASFKANHTKRFRDFLVW